MSSQRAFKERFVSQFEKWNEQPCVLIMPYLQERHWIDEICAIKKRTDRLSARA